MRDHYIANHVTLDHETGHAYVDGVKLPWWLADSPSVEIGEFLSTVNIGIQCENVTVIRRKDDFENPITPLALRGSMNGALWLSGRDHP